MPSAIATRTSAQPETQTKHDTATNSVSRHRQSEINVKEVAIKDTTCNIPLTDISVIDTVDIDDLGTDITKVNDAKTGNASIKQIRTTCPYCGVGCGVLATIDNGVISVKGDPEHPANYGKLCSKGSALAQTLGEDRRLTQPYYQDKHTTMKPSYRLDVSLTSIKEASPKSISNTAVASSINNPNHVHDNQVIRHTDWDSVTQDIAQKLTNTIAKHGADSVMFYTSGQLLTEDYYVANKLMKGFIGSNNIDSNSRLCMSSAVAGHKRSFGADLVPGSYSDLENCDLLVLIGSNMAWCHPILFGRFLQAKKADPNKKLVVIDPRRTDSCEFADLHLPIVAGTDTHLYNGLLTYLYQNGHEDKDYTQYCDGLDAALEAAQDWSIAKVAEATQVDATLIEAFYKMVEDNDKTVSGFSMGINQSSTGTDKVNAIINTHLLTGRVGKIGANPFSLTGQPNAMGGREVGALANLLAAHLKLEDSEHRQAVADFWQTPQAISPTTGLRVCDVADAILEGKVKAIWIMATNPIVSVPDADNFRKALSECELVIVSECSVDSDTVRCADIVLPAQGWAEKSGTVTNSERRISRQRQLLPAVGQAKPDWWIMSEVAKRMGFHGFDYQHAGDVFNEYVALTSYRNGDSRNGDSRNGDIADSVTSTIPNVDYAAEIESSSKLISNDLPRYLNIAKTLTASTKQLETDNQNRVTLPLSKQQYDELTPLQWGESQIDMTGASFKHHQLNFVAITPPVEAGGINSYQPSQTPLHRNRLKDEGQGSHQDKNNGLKLRLLTGRLRDQWHTMTRTALAPSLNQQQSEPTITISPNDAQKLGILDANLDVKKNTYIKLNSSLPTPSNTAYDISTNFGAYTNVVANVTVSDDMREGDSFMPIHWSDAFANRARVGSLVPTKFDAASGQPELKNSAVFATPVPIHSFAKILIHPELRDIVTSELRQLISDSQYRNISSQDDAHDEPVPNLLFSLSRQENSVLLTVAIPSIKLAAVWVNAEFWQSLFEKITSRVNHDNHSVNGITSNITDTSLKSSIVLHPEGQQLRLIIQHRSANDKVKADVINSELLLAVYIGADREALPSTHWLDGRFADMSEVPSVKWLLAGRPASGYIDPGPMVCACMGVGENIIINAIKENSCTNAVSVGQCTKAGTNCGSCVGQINELIEEYA